MQQATVSSYSFPRVKIIHPHGSSRCSELLVRVVVMLLGALLSVACTTTTLHKSDGRLSDRYALKLSSVTGSVTEPVMRSAITDAFIENGVSIDSTADQLLICSCNTSTSRNEYALYAVSAYHVSLRCSANNLEFDVHGTSRVLERFFTALTVGMALESSVPPHIILAGILIDVMVMMNAESAYLTATTAAIKRAVTKRFTSP